MAMQAVIEEKQQSLACSSNKEETKMTALGKIPVSWEVVELGYVCREAEKKDRSKKIVPEDRHKLLTVKLYAKGVIWRNLPDTKKFKPSRLFQVKKNDFVYSKIDARNGAWGIIEKDFEGALVSGDFPILEIDFTKISKTYFKLLMGREKMWLPLKDISSGTTGRRRVNPKEFLRLLKIPLAPLSEQKAIARILTTIQDAISSQETLIAKFKELKRSMMQHLFTYGTNGEKTKMTEIGEIPESWDLINIEKMGKIITGSTPSTKKAEYYNPKEIDFIAPADIGYGRYIYSSDKQISLAGFEVNRPISKDAVCCVCIGSSIGKVAKAYKDRSTTNQQINSIICDKTFVSDFIYYTMVFYSDYWKKYATFGPVPILSKGMLGKIKLPVCLDVDEQIKIAKSLVAVDQKIESALEKVSSYHNLFKTLLHELMSGQTRIEG